MRESNPAAAWSPATGTLQPKGPPLLQPQRTKDVANGPRGSEIRTPGAEGRSEAGSFHCVASESHGNVAEGVWNRLGSLVATSFDAFWGRRDDRSDRSNRGQETQPQIGYFADDDCVPAGNHRARRRLGSCCRRHLERGRQRMNRPHALVLQSASASSPATAPAMPVRASPDIRGDSTA
jgi:hypothetical protein